MSERLRVLVVEDNSADVDLIRERMSVIGLLSFQIDSVPRLSEALDRLERERFDLIFIDLGLPDSQGLETFHKLQRAAPDIPAIILTGYDDEETAMSAVRGGAQDYLIKGELTGNLLVRAARYAVERKRAEEALRGSEARYRVLFEETRLGILVADARTQRFLYANQSISRMLGYTTEELLRMGVADIHPQESLPRVQSEFEAQIRQEKTLAPGLPCLRKDGTVFYADINSSPIHIDGRQRNVAFFTDITERKRAEEERNILLLRQEGVNLLQQSLLAPATLDQKLKKITDSIVRLFGADFCRIWLIRPGDLCERGCIHAEVQAGPHVCRYRDRCLHLLASSGRYTHVDGKGHGRVPFGCYKIGRVASGEDHKFITNDVQNDPRVHDHEWTRALGLVSFAGYQLRVPGGQTMGVLALFAQHPIMPAEDTMLDGLSSTIALVVRQAEGDEALRRAEENYRRSLDDSPLGVRIVTEDGATLYANKAVLDFYGYDSLEELNNTPIKRRYTPESYAEFTKRKQQRQNGNSPPHSEYEISIVRKNGEVRVLHVSRKDVLWNGEKQYQALYLDVTERQRAADRLEETLQSLHLAITSTIRVMGRLVEARDPYTAGHQQNTTILAEAIAVEMGLSPEKIEGLRLAGQVHDVGKISVPAEILNKATGLTPAEFKLVKTHAQKGYEILKDVEFPWPLAEIVYQHHERRDGSGYPRGLKGDEILMEARILGVADTMEAMASHRPYRAALGPEAALEEIDKNKGVLYDADVARACIKLFRERGFRFDDGGSPI